MIYTCVRAYISKKKAGEKLITYIYSVFVAWTEIITKSIGYVDGPTSKTKKRDTHFARVRGKRPLLVRDLIF